MKGFIDLHIHTTFSDGSKSPKEVVKHAAELGLRVLAITDHDTVDGINIALKEAGKYNLRILPGIEISVDFNPEIHLLGYFFKGNYKNIEDNLLTRLRKARHERNIKSINKLKELGVNIEYHEVKEKAKGEIVGRPHIAAVLIEKGYGEDIKKTFDKFLAIGAPAYFSKARLTPEEGIREILYSGGIPILAHPLSLNLNFSDLDFLFKELKSIGLKGIEAYYTDHTDRDTKSLIALAKKHDFLITGGSDFHGNMKPDIKIGKGYGDLKVPYTLFEALENFSNVFFT